MKTSPNTFFRDEERNKISSIIDWGIFHGRGSVSFAISPRGAYKVEFSDESITQVILELSKNFDIPMQNPFLPIRNHSMICQPDLRLNITKLNNLLHNNFHFGESIHFNGNLNIDTYYRRFSHTLAENNSEKMIILRGTENYLWFDNECFDGFREFMENIIPYGIHLICMCNADAFHDPICRLLPVDLIQYIKPLTPQQLIIIYNAKALELGLNLQEGYIEWIVDQQAKVGYFYPSFGISILENIALNQW